MSKRLLVVDSDPQFRQDIGAWLQNTEFDLRLAESLEEALVQMQPGGIDIVLADLNWPQLEGLKMISRILELYPATAVIAVSEFADRELEQEAFRCGAFACLTKPLQEEELLPVLESASSVRNLEMERANSGFLPGKQIEQILLHGFTPDQQWDFKMIGSVRTYHAGEPISLDEESGSMIWVERGSINVYYNASLVERLELGDFWGEETFVNPGVSYTQLVAQDEVQLRQFRRRRIMDFLTYQDETLTKHYMINLIHCTCLKLKRAIVRLGTCQEQAKE